MDWNLILNAIYVFLTLVLAIVAIVSMRQNQQLRKDMIKPNIIPSIETNQMGGLICLVFRNYGGTPARDIKVRISDVFRNSLLDCGKFGEELLDGLDRLSELQFLLVPNQKELCALGGAPNFKNISKVPLDLEIEYIDVFGKVIREEFSIDINGYGLFLTKNNDMDTIATSLSRINDNMKKIIKG